MTHDIHPPLRPIGILAHYSYKRDIFTLVFAFLYSDVIKTKTRTQTQAQAQTYRQRHRHTDKDTDTDTDNNRHIYIIT